MASCAPRAVAVALLVALSSLLLAGHGVQASRSLQQSAPTASPVKPTASPAKPSPSPAKPSPSPAKPIPSPAKPTANVTTNATANATATVTQQVQGKLTHKDAHKRQIWSLTTTTGDYFNLTGQPNDTLSGMPVPAGAVIVLNCTFNSSAVLGGVAGEPRVVNCTRIGNATIRTASAPVKTTGLNIKLLVLVLSLTGSCNLGGAQVSAVQSAFTSASGYANFMKDCSYGKVVMDSVTVVGTPVSCSTAIRNRCNEDSMATAARAYVTAQYGSSYLNGFTHFTYVIPNGLVSTCGWVGLAELPGTQTWYSPDADGVYNKGTVMQEIVHNLNIYHGWRNGVEYDDNSTSMGMGNSCPSAPELWRLGWASVADQLNTSTFPSKVFRAYTLPATYLGPDKAMVKIQPDWMGTSYTKNVYLALRVKAGGDKDLLEEFNRKINVHELAKSIDNNFLATGDPKVSIIGTIAAGASTDLKTYKLLVKAEALLESGTKMSIKVCRYDVSSSECKDSVNPSPASPRLPPPVVAPSPARSPPPVQSSPTPKLSPPVKAPPPARLPPPARSSPSPLRSPPPKLRSPPPQWPELPAPGDSSPPSTEPAHAPPPEME